MMELVVGEFANGYGYLRPNPVSIRPECFRLRFGIARCMQKLQKMKILGVFRQGIMIPDTIRPREYSTGGDTDGGIHGSDDDPNVLNANRNDDGQWLNTNWDKPDNKWNDNGAFAFLVPQPSSFLLSLLGGVLLCKLSTPTPEHPADLIDL